MMMDWPWRVELSMTVRRIRKAPLAFAVLAATTAVAFALISTAAFVGKLVRRGEPTFADLDSLALVLGASVAPSGSRVDYFYDPSVFNGLTEYLCGSATLTSGEWTDRSLVAQVAPNFFSVLGVNPYTGRALRSEDRLSGSPNVAVISDELSRAPHSRNVTAVGSRLDIAGEHYEVVGVAPAGFNFPCPTHVWISQREGRYFAVPLG